MLYLHPHHEVMSCESNQLIDVIILVVTSRNVLAFGHEGNVNTLVDFLTAKTQLERLLYLYTVDCLGDEQC